MDNLATLFDYDLWANGLWLETLRQKGWPEPDTGILRHVLAAQEVWLLRVQGESPTQFPPQSLTPEALQALTQRWKDRLASDDPNRVVAYSRLNGEPCALPLWHIARHVINHGTYHRGELRGLCLARGDDAFPETDLVAFRP